MGQPNPVAVLDKAVAILRAVADEPASLAELVARTGLPRATAHRLAVALEGHRLVQRTADGAWAPGPALAELGRSGTGLAEIAEPPPRGAARRQRRERPVLRARGRHPGLRRRGRADQRPARHGAGRRAAAHDGRVGRARPARLRAGRRGHPAAAERQFTARTLLDVRRRGWAHSVAEREPGVASLSAPVRDGPGAVLGAVSISGPVERLGRRPSPEIVGAVLDAAAAISRAAR